MAYLFIFLFAIIQDHDFPDYIALTDSGPDHHITAPLTAMYIVKSETVLIYSYKSGATRGQQ